MLLFTLKKDMSVKISEDFWTIMKKLVLFAYHGKELLVVSPCKKCRPRASAMA